MVIIMNEDLWKIYEANKEWIKFADTKAIAFIAIRRRALTTFLIFI